MRTAYVLPTTLHIAYCRNCCWCRCSYHFDCRYHGCGETTHKESGFNKNEHRDIHRNKHRDEDLGNIVTFFTTSSFWIHVKLDMKNSIHRIQFQFKEFNSKNSPSIWIWTCRDHDPEQLSNGFNWKVCSWHWTLCIFTRVLFWLCNLYVMVKVWNIDERIEEMDRLDRANGWVSCSTSWNSGIQVTQIGDWSHKVNRFLSCPRWLCSGILFRKHCTDDWFHVDKFCLPSMNLTLLRELRTHDRCFRNLCLRTFVSLGFSDAAGTDQLRWNDLTNQVRNACLLLFLKMKVFLLGRGLWPFDQAETISAAARLDCVFETTIWPVTVAGHNSKLGSCTQQGIVLFVKILNHVDYRLRKCFKTMWLS